jgi:hypothetical protein
MKKSRLVTFICAFLASTSVLSWEISKEFTAAPIKGSKACVVEQKPVFINFNPHGTSRDLRINCGGFGSRYSTQELAVITNNLLKKNALDSDFSKLSIGRFFYVKKVFYLISVNPAVVISVPSEFSLSQRDMGNVQMQYFGVGSHFARLREESRSSGLNYLLAEIAENWINNVYFSSVFKNEEGAEVVSELFTKPVLLEVETRDSSWPFRIFESKRFPGHMEFESRMAP